MAVLLEDQEPYQEVAEAEDIMVAEEGEQSPLPVTTDIVSFHLSVIFFINGYRRSVFGDADVTVKSLPDMGGGGGGGSGYGGGCDPKTYLSAVGNVTPSQQASSQPYSRHLLNRYTH